jgi:ribonucleoside-diphosphate reductase alpha chain
MQVQIDPARDALLTDFGRATLRDRYLLEGESYQDLFARVAVAYADKDDEAHAQRLYDYISKLWFMPATPVLSNGGTTRGLPISCYLNSVDDSLDGIVNTWNENVWLASRGGGIGTYYGNVRGIGEPVGLNGKTSGVVPFIKVMDSLTLAISQGSLRRGSAAVYIDVSHPEIEEFLEIRKPSGDFNRKALNLHHGVLLTDKFMEAVRDDADFDLVSPKDGAVRKTINARSLFQRLVETRLATGEPYIVFSDTVNLAMPAHHRELGLKVSTSNLCVAPETQVLTREGYREIEALAGNSVDVWNGEEWSPVDVVKTGVDQNLITVSLSDGSTLDCTPYHKFYVVRDYGTDPVEVRAGELSVGDKLIKWTAPVVIEGTEFEEAYTNGFFSGDGTYTKSGRPLIWLYGAKRELAPLLGGVHRTAEDRDAIYYRKGDLAPKFTVPLAAGISSRLAWLAGLLDADGCVSRNGNNLSLQLSNINLPFLEQTQRLLHTLGCQPKIALMHEARQVMLPNGHGGSALFDCQPCYRLLLTSNDTEMLRQLGLPVQRLQLEPQTPQRDARRFVTVDAVDDNGRIDDTYCFTEHRRGMAVFNGVLTGQCAEIVLPTGIDHLGNDRTAVCCLSSLNLEKWDEWNTDGQFIEDVMRFLDNVLQDYIDRAEPSMARAAYSASRERSVGLGVMGFHSFLQLKGLGMESAMAKAWNLKMFKHINRAAQDASEVLAWERGANPDWYDAPHGNPQRFSCKMAIAPTASISIICGGTSACIEPIPANIYTHKTLSGSFVVKNQYLEQVLDDAEDRIRPDNPIKWRADIWNSILEQGGSVQHLSILSPQEKATFKTSFEIDQRWLLELAGDRAPLIDQAQSLNLFIPADCDKWELMMLHFNAWQRGIKSLYYLRSKSVQRAGFAGGGVEADNTLEPKHISVVAAPVDYAECLSCQ